MTPSAARQTAIVTGAESAGETGGVRVMSGGGEGESGVDGRERPSKA